MKHNAFALLLFVTVVSTGPAYAKDDKLELYNGYSFALGTGAAIVKFDTKIKVLDKQSGTSIFLDPEGNLDLPETSRVTTVYGNYNFSNIHSVGFSFFGVRRESSLFSLDKTFEEVSVVGDASITDTTNFYSLDYGYTLFHDERSRIKLLVGIYGIDLKYVFEAEGNITIDNNVAADSIIEEANIFAPLPLIGLDFWFRFTPKWSMATRVGFVAGSYEDLSAVVFQAGFNAQYKFNKHIGGILGLTSFAADVSIEDDLEKQDISYSYDGLFMGLHFVF
jgi:hypothetical protein